MYPTQCYPTQTPYYNPYLQPQVNAVKIDINNPQAYGGTNSQGQINPVAPQQTTGTMYSYPYAPMYAMPQVPQYTTPASYPIPPMIDQQQTYYQPPVVTMAAQPATTQDSNQTTATTAQPQPIPPVPIIPAPVINTAATIPTPVVAPVPVATPTTAPLVSAPVTQTVNVAPSIPAAVVDSPQNTTVSPVAPVSAQSPAQDGVNVNELLSNLGSTNPDTQTAAIQKIAEVAQTNPAAAKALLNEQTFGQLVKVINADTSKLEGPKGKSDPQNLSPLEKAEINKQFAIYTLAILQKNFRDEINKEMKKNNLPDIAINDLPYIKEGIVDNLKDNPNPTIREACLSALNYVGRPEDKDVLKVLYDISAKHDSNSAVRTSAQDYLSKLPA